MARQLRGVKLVWEIDFHIPLPRADAENFPDSSTLSVESNAAAFLKGAKCFHIPTAAVTRYRCCVWRKLYETLVSNWENKCKVKLFPLASPGNENSEIYYYKK